MSYKVYNPNPANHSAGDCVIRCVCKLMNLDWDTAYLKVCMAGFKMKEVPTANHVWGSFLFENGFVKKVIPDTCPYCYTIRDFCVDHPFGEFAAATGSHVVAVVNGDYYDSWDSGNEVPVYYWERETIK